MIIKIIMQRKQYCQLRPHPIVAILDAKNFKVKYDFLNFPRVPACWNVIICELWHSLLFFFSVLKFEIEIPWSHFWLLDSIKKNEILIKLYEFSVFNCFLCFQYIKNNPAKWLIYLMCKKLNLKPIFPR